MNRSEYPTYAGDFQISGSGQNNYLIRRHADIVRHLFEFWKKLSDILYTQYFVTARPTSPIRTIVKESEDDHQYSEFFTFEGMLYFTEFIVPLKITYERAVHGKYADLPQDNLIVQLLPGTHKIYPGAQTIEPFTMQKECWNLMEHGETEQEKMAFLNDFAHIVAQRITGNHIHR